jgi:hypothetical protein
MHINTHASDLPIPPMQTIPWAIWVLPLDFQFLVSQLLPQVARSKQAKVDPWAFNDQDTAVVDKVAARTEQFSRWKTWVWLLESMGSM